MNTYYEPNLGIDDGPPSANAYKRAVYKAAPTSFAVELLQPQKQGNSYSYGMRIIPVKRDSDRQSTLSGISGNSGSSGDSSSSSGMEYEIWRKWEDCLYFQDLLENQYARMAREKRARLHAGKGVKKNGVYPHEDPMRHMRAASFESLPPGPDPHMIAKDVHEFLPRLTKKGTLFKASQTTIEQRAYEFAQLIQVLLQDGDNVPSLICELRQLRVVRDFFGFWRRDHDRVERDKAKDGKARSRADSLLSGSPPASSRNSSVFGSSFGMYFSASNLSLQLPTTLAFPQELPPQEKRVRRPPEMAEKLAGMVAIPPASPNTPTSIKSANPTTGLQAPYTQRTRAQTLLVIPSSSNTEASSSQSTLTQSTQNLAPPETFPSNQATKADERPPVSAPAGIGFKFTMHTEDGEKGQKGNKVTDDKPSTEHSAPVPTSQPVPTPPRPSRAFRPAPKGSPPSVPISVRISDISLLSSAKFKGPDLIIPEPRVEDMLDFPVDEDLYDDIDEEHLAVLREHEHLMPRPVNSAPQSSPGIVDHLGLGLRPRLQDLTIEEEDDDVQTQEEGTVHEHGYDHEQEHEHEHGYEPDRQNAVDGGHDIGQNFLTPSEEEPIVLLPPIPRTPRIGGTAGEVPAGNRNGFIFMPPQQEDDDINSSLDGHSIIERTHSPRLVAARADALSILTKTKSDLTLARVRSPSPLPAQLLTPSSSSVRTSGSSGTAPSLDTQASAGVHANTGNARPVSIQSSNASIEYDGRFSLSSPVILHNSLFGEPEDLKIPNDNDVQIVPQSISPPRSEFTHAHRMNDSVASTRSFMTNCSADAIMPRRSMSPPPLPVSPRHRTGSLRRSLSTGSRRARHTGSSPSSPTLGDHPWSEEGEELLDAYFGDVPSPAPHSGDDRFSLSSSPQQESFFSGSQPIDFPMRSPARPLHFGFPGTPSSSGRYSQNSPRNSILSTTDSIAPSIASSLFDDLNAVSIKAIFGDHIVAFRIDRASSLSAVRAKLYDKFVNQQNVRISDKFTLTYRPSALGRPQHNQGRIRANSVSSMGRHDPGQLRIIFSEKDWQDAVSCCGPKITIHVLNTS